MAPEPQRTTVETLIDIAAEGAARYGDRPALVMRAGLRDEVWSYRRLWQAVNAVAACLHNDHGVRPGDRLLFCVPNSPQMVASFLGAMLARAIAVPLDPQSAPNFIERVAQDTEAVALIAEKPLQLPGLRVLVLDDSVFDSAVPLFRPCPAPEDVAEIIYTSGTTGEPKGVVLSHRNIVSNVKSVERLVSDRRRWRMLSLLPLSHMFEQTAGLFAPLDRGDTVFYGTSLQSAVILKALQRYRIVTMVVVPQLLVHMMRALERGFREAGRWRSWVRMQRLAGYLPSGMRRYLFHKVHREMGGSLDILMCGGAYLPPELARAWERMGFKVVEGYGASECSPVIAGNSLQRRVTGSVGKAAPGVEIRLSPQGDIQVRGPNVSCGYWRNAGATRDAFTTDGWFRTGDLATIDDAGDLRLKGRLKDMVVLPTGMNVFLEDIEAELERQPGVLACAVLDVVRPSGDVGFTAVLLMEDGQETQTGASARAEAAVRGANARLAPYQRVSGTVVWQETDFPRTAIGKIKRHAVRAWLEEKSRAPVRASTPPLAREGPLSRLLPILSEISGIDGAAIGPDSDLNLDLGLNSLSRVELALLLEQQFGVIIDDGDFAGLEKVGQLVALVEQGGAAAPGLQSPAWSLTPIVQGVRALLQLAVVFPAHRAVARPFVVEGAARLADIDLPALFIANHGSHVDTVSIIRALPVPVRRRLAVAAATDYFYRIPTVGFLTTLLLNTFPFSRQGAVRASLEHCGSLVDKGWSILIYPEGTRSASGELLPFKSGIGLLASGLNVAVVPIAVLGSREVLPKGKSLPRPGPIQVKIGNPVKLPKNIAPDLAASRLRQLVSALMQSATEPADGSACHETVKAKDDAAK